VLQRYVGEVEDSEVSESRNVRGTTSQTLQGTYAAFGLDPGWLVSKVSDVTRGTVPPRSDALAPRLKVIRRDFQRLEEVGSTTVVPFRRDQGDRFHVSGLISSIARSVQRNVVDYFVNDFLGEHP